MDIEIEGVDGQIFHVHGRKAGHEGIALGDTPLGMIDVPVTTRWTQTADGEGASPNGVRFEPTDLELVFHTRETRDSTVPEIDSRFRRAWDYPDPERPNRATIVRVGSPLSGTRELRVNLRESPAKSDKFDMHHTRYTRTQLAVRAAKTFWAGHPDVQPVRAEGASGTAMITVWNPTDRPVSPRWVLQPGCRWVIPDFDFKSGTRTIGLPASYASHEVSINTKRGEQMIRIEGWPNAQEAMGGVLFSNTIPAHTPPTEIPVSWTDNTGSPVAAMFMDRFWTRPLGME